MKRLSDADLTARLAGSFPDGLQAWLSSTPVVPMFHSSIRTFDTLESPDRDKRTLRLTGGLDALEQANILRKLGAVVTSITATQIEYVWA